MSSNTTFINFELQLLTAEITNKNQLKNELSNLLLPGCKCRTCKGNDSLKHIHKNDERKLNYMCDTCIKLVQRTDLGKLGKNRPSFCEVCEEEDGDLFIPGLTNNLCSDCYNTIKQVK